MYPKFHDFPHYLMFQRFPCWWKMFRLSRWCLSPWKKIQRFLMSHEIQHSLMYPMCRGILPIPLNQKFLMFRGYPLIRWCRSYQTFRVSLRYRLSRWFHAFLTCLTYRMYPHLSRMCLMCLRFQPP